MELGLKSHIYHIFLVNKYSHAEKDKTIQFPANPWTPVVIKGLIPALIETHFCPYSLQGRSQSAINTIIQWTGMTYLLSSLLYLVHPVHHSFPLGPKGSHGTLV